MAFFGSNLKLQKNRKLLINIHQIMKKTNVTTNLSNFKDDIYKFVNYNQQNPTRTKTVGCNTRIQKEYDKCELYKNEINFFASNVKFKMYMPSGTPTNYQYLTDVGR
jgi:hypothetical protein